MNAYPDLPAALETLDPMARDDLRNVLIRDQASRDAISSRLLRYRDQNGQDWADIIDLLTCIRRRDGGRCCRAIIYDNALREIKDSTDSGYEGWKLRGVASEAPKEAAKRAWAEADRNLSGPPPGGWQGH